MTRLLIKILRTSSFGLYTIIFKSFFFFLFFISFYFSFSFSFSLSLYFYFSLSLYFFFYFYSYLFFFFSLLFFLFHFFLLLWLTDFFSFCWRIFNRFMWWLFKPWRLYFWSWKNQIRISFIIMNLNSNSRILWLFWRHLFNIFNKLISFSHCVQISIAN